eukprot:GAHX01000399.1.p1 GENE.GAHX01000399.1~~GAHX01000399.1.p1  ORF type:complete len:130 (-),score=31.04 GAHX01000399.1:59-448(-)
MSNNEQTENKAHPLATEQLESKILKNIKPFMKAKMIKKGINEVTKALNRGTALMVFIAADTVPFEIVLSIPDICEQKSVPFVYVNSGKLLGESVNLTNKTAALAIIDGYRADNFKHHLVDLEKEIDKLI